MRGNDDLLDTIPYPAALEPFLIVWYLAGSSGPRQLFCLGRVRYPGLAKMAGKRKRVDPLHDGRGTDADPLKLDNVENYPRKRISVAVSEQGLGILWITANGSHQCNLCRFRKTVSRQKPPFWLTGPVCEDHLN